MAATNITRTNSKVAYEATSAKKIDSTDEGKS